MGKKNKYGNYLMKIGYLDIRQVITMPRVANVRGKTQKSPGNVEVFVYHGKHKVSGPFKSHIEAIKSAETLITDGFKYNKHGK
tara:strand:- start:147 stop:395 length:249 start_codon:yes stop_codon:yes gene_type:complete